MLCREVSVGRGTSPVHLNVYDLMTSVNGYAYWLGLGVYHSGVEVHGVEYAFGSHEYPTSGIFEGEPKQCDGFTFRKSILIGWTDLPPEEVGTLMEELSEKYRGNAYDLISMNCNHFCDDAAVKLTGNQIPSWVNRLARIGLLCKCIIPTKLNLTKVGHHKADDEFCELDKKKLKSHSRRFTNSSPDSSSSSSPAATGSRSSSLPPSPPQGKRDDK